MAVNDATGTIYIATGNSHNGILCRLSSGAECAGTDFPIADVVSGGGERAWNAVAVDPNGNVWAANGLGLYVFSPSGAKLEEIPVGGGVAAGDVKSLAFDDAGNLYLAAFNSGSWKYPAPGYDEPVQFDPNNAANAVAVDRASGDVYVAHQEAIERYGAGGKLIERFPPVEPAGELTGLAVDEATKAVYAFEGEGTNQVNVFEALILPDLATAPLSDLTETSATLNGSVGPDGLALTACKFEYVTEAAYLESGFEDLSSGGKAECEPAFGSIPTTGTTPVSAAISGLAPGGRYRFRLSASNANGTNSSETVAFQLAQPGVETIGSPLRTATTARLDSRIDPHGIATEYHFEYLTDSAYQANLDASKPPFEGATQTPSRSAGSGGLIVLASEAVTGLSPGTTYRYRAIADNGAFGGAAAGEARTLTTRASDAPLTHGPFPGPAGSDRAWEQVNTPDTSGNPISLAAGIASSGEAALYQVSGGTSGSEAGTLYNFLFARRPPGEHPTSGWQTESVFPPREDATFSAWRPPTADDQLSTVLGLNTTLEPGSGAGVWQMPTTGGAPAKLYEASPGTYAGLYVFSDDGSRALLLMKGNGLDKGHASPSGATQLYDVSSGEPRMVSLLPGTGASDPGPSCGAPIGTGLFELPETNWVVRTTHWLSADGKQAFFATAGNGPCGSPHLYVRDLEAEESFQVDGPAEEGPECPGALIRSTPVAAYLWTQAKLSPQDSVIAGSCAGGSGPGGDVYRYDLASHEFTCLTCGLPGDEAANVLAEAKPGRGAPASIAVPPGGSRVYFSTRSQLLPGAAEAGKPAIYRVNTESQNLAYVGPLNPGDNVGENPVGEFSGEGTALSPDGRFLAFRSAAAGLNQLTGSNNNNTAQFYLYDDAERSLLCVSCPPDGSAPRAAAAKGIVPNAEPGPNITSLAENGDFAFATPTALVNADQNTAAGGEAPEAGTDVYEWRDGRPLLVSDGLTDWPEGAAPKVAAISPSGLDLFFLEAAQLTPDALEGFQRLYDARIGGGIEFPPSKEPCPLEACQGIPKGAPEEGAPGSSSFQGPGNETPPCGKGKHRVKGRCVAKKHKGKKGKPHKKGKHGKRGRGR